MPARVHAPLITTLYGDDGLMYLVRADNPAQAYRLAAEQAASEDMVMLSTEGQVLVEWARSVPCNPASCWQGGGHTSHYIPARPGRGAFRAAFIPIRDATDGEVAAREARFLWGVATDGGPVDRTVQPVRTEERAWAIAEMRRHTDPGRIHRVYHREVGGRWRPIVDVPSPLL